VNGLIAPKTIALPVGDGPLATALRSNLANWKGKRVEALGPGVDIAIVAEHPDPVAMVAAWAQAGAGVVVVFGSALTADAPAFAAAVRGTRTRLLGPGTFGIALPWQHLNVTPMARAPHQGALAVLGQSGSLLGAIMDWGAAEGLGFSLVACVGARADLDWPDLLDRCGDDHRTRAILIAFEAVGDVGALLSAVRAVALRKPVVVLHVAQDPDDPAVHALRDAALDAALARVGALGVRSLADLVYHAEVLAGSPPATGPRLRIIANAGGPAMLAAQQAWTGGAHPEVVDLGRIADPVAWRSALDAANADPAVDGVLAVLAPLGHSIEATRAIAAAVVAARAGKPLLAAFLGGPAVAAARVVLRRGGIPEFPWPEGAVRAFIGLWRHGDRLAALYQTPTPSTPLAAGDLIAALDQDATLADPFAMIAPLLGIVPGTGAGVAVRLEVVAIAGLGPVLRLGPSGPAGASLGIDATGIPPLNQALASDLVARAAVAALLDGPARIALAALVARTAELALAVPRLATLILDPVWNSSAGCQVGAVRLSGHAPSIPTEGLPSPAIRPYPIIHESAARLKDGRLAQVRPLRPDDEPAVLAFHQVLGAESVRLRWFHPVSLAERTTHQALVRVCHVDWRRELVLGLFDGETIVAIGRLNRGRDPGEAELALVVADRWQRHGVGAALMGALVAAARGEGLHRLTLAYLPENQGMAALSRRHGFALRRLPDDDAISGELRFGL